MTNADKWAEIMTNEIDVTKPCVTGDGRTAEFVAEVKNEKYPLVFAANGDYGQVCIQVDRYGNSRGGFHTCDIINAPQTRKVWLPVHVHPDGHLRIWGGDIEYDKKPNHNYGNGGGFISWQGPFEITDEQR